MGERLERGREELSPPLVELKPNRSVYGRLLVHEGLYEQLKKDLKTKRWPVGVEHEGGNWLFGFLNPACAFPSQEEQGPGFPAVEVKCTDDKIVFSTPEYQIEWRAKERGVKLWKDGQPVNILQPGNEDDKNKIFFEWITVIVSRGSILAQELMEFSNPEVLTEGEGFQSLKIQILDGSFAVDVPLLETDRDLTKAEVRREFKDDLKKLSSAANRLWTFFEGRG